LSQGTGLKAVIPHKGVSVSADSYSPLYQNNQLSRTTLAGKLIGFFLFHPAEKDHHNHNEQLIYSRIQEGIPALYLSLP